MPKRRERVAPPPALVGWDFRYATSDAVSGWEKVCTAAPGNARTAWERITTDPRERNERQNPLRGTLGSRLINGEPLEQWQYEVTGAGRLWYCIDDRRRIVWLIEQPLVEAGREDDEVGCRVPGAGRARRRTFP